MCLRFMERLEDLTEAGATSSSRLTRTRPISALPREGKADWRWVQRRLGHRGRSCLLAKLHRQGEERDRT